MSPRQPTSDTGMEVGSGGSASQKAAMIWVLTWGTRGDHEPAVALALGLKESGHRVRVFGSVEMRKTFSAHGLDFDALDMDALAHPASQHSVRRETLGALADDAGFEGPNKVEDFLFDTKLLLLEYFNRRFITLLEGGKTIEEAMLELMPELMEGDRNKVTGQGVEVLDKTRGKHSAFLAEFHKQALEDYLPIARKARSDFQAFLRPVAKEVGCTPYELLNTISSGLLFHLTSVTTNAQKGDVKNRFVETVKDFDSWYDILAKDANGSLDEYWERWMSRFPPLEGCLGAKIKESSPRATLNMQFWYDSACPEERPDLIVAHGLVFSAALQLQAKAKGELKVLYWTATTTHLQNLNALAMNFAGQVGIEGEWPGVAQPVRNAGPLSYVRMLQSGQFLASTTALTMRTASPSLGSVKDCCTGQWVLDGFKSEQRQGSSEMFGTQQEREELEAFLAAEGGAPVYFGWGSMPATNGGPEGLAKLIVKTLRKVGRRGVVVAGWSALRQSTLHDAIEREYEGDSDGAQRARRQILLLARASHAFLFPKCACIVQHGGSGTIHAALRAGVPTVIAPFGVDQPANADWVLSLGCGVKVANLAEVTPEDLAEAIATVLGWESYKVKAKEVAEIISQERGVATAVEKVEKCLREPQPPYAAPSPMRPTWVDGRYELQKGSESDLPVAVQVSGEGVYAADLENVPVGHMRAGDFRVEDNDDDIKPGCYTVQAVLGVTLMYGTVSPDGHELVWHNGARYAWKAKKAEPQPAPGQQGLKWIQGPGGAWTKAPMLLEDGMYCTWRGVKLPFPPTAVRGGKFFMGETEMGGMEAGAFELKESADGRKAGKYPIKASWPKLAHERFGSVSADGKKLILDDGSSLQWDGPLP